MSSIWRYSAIALREQLVESNIDPCLPSLKTLESAVKSEKTIDGVSYRQTPQLVGLKSFFANVKTHFHSVVDNWTDAMTVIREHLNYSKFLFSNIPEDYVFETQQNREEVESEVREQSVNRSEIARTELEEDKTFEEQSEIEKQIEDPFYNQPPYKQFEQMTDGFQKFPEDMKHLFNLYECLKKRYQMPEAVMHYFIYNPSDTGATETQI